MALDQFHEQSIKGDSGIVGVIEDPSTIHRWMLAGLEITRAVTQFEELMGDVSATTSHHEQTPYHQVAFAKDTNFVISTFNELGNQFLECSKELLTLDIIMTKGAV